MSVDQLVLVDLLERATMCLRVGRTCRPEILISVVEVLLELFRDVGLVGWRQAQWREAPTDLISPVRHDRLLPLGRSPGRIPPRSGGGRRAPVCPRRSAGSTAVGAYPASPPIGLR